MTLIPRKKVSSGRFVERFTLTALQVIEKKVSLLNIPLLDSVVVDSPVGTVQFLGVDYIISGLEVSWNGFGLETILEENDKLIITYS